MPALSRSSLQISKERAKKALRDAGLTQREVAQHLGIDETKLSKTLAGTRRFTVQELTAFATLTGVDADWLQTKDSEPVEPSSRRETVLNVAWRLFAEYGYERVRIADIAEQAGVSSTSVMYHFKSKSEIFLACLKHVETRTEPVYQAILQDSGTSFEKLSRLTTTHLPDSPETRRQWAVWLQFWGSSATHDDVKTATQTSYTTWHTRVAELVATAQADGWLPGTEFFAETLTSLLDGLGIRIMSGVATPEEAKTILYTFYTNHLVKPHHIG